MDWRRHQRKSRLSRTTTCRQPADESAGQCWQCSALHRQRRWPAGHWTGPAAPGNHDLVALLTGRGCCLGARRDGTLFHSIPVNPRTQADGATEIFSSARNARARWV